MTPRPAAIDALAADPGASGLVVDFDGVLSPIVDDPETSAMPGSVAASLTQLAGQLRLLAVMSGRPAKFLQSRVRIDGVALIGTYGIEEIRDGKLHIDPRAEPWRTPVMAAGETLRDELASSPGVRVEMKSVSVAVHWRQAPDEQAAAAAVRHITARIAAETGLKLEPGKLVEELRPPVEIDKGTAIRKLLAPENLRAVAYAGDDIGDLPALHAVHEEHNGYALLVDHGPETKRELREVADQSFAGTAGFARWLAELADALSA